MSRREVLTRALGSVRAALEVYEDAVATARAQAFLQPVTWLAQMNKPASLLTWLIVMVPPSIAITAGRGVVSSILLWGTVLVVGWFPQAWYRPLDWVTLPDHVVDTLYEEIWYAIDVMHDLEELRSLMPPPALSRRSFLALGTRLDDAEASLTERLEA
jgi:hypothetical protein